LILFSSIINYKQEWIPVTKDRFRREKQIEIISMYILLINRGNQDLSSFQREFQYIFREITT
jgi:hypothetical protein